MYCPALRSSLLLFLGGTQYKTLQILIFPLTSETQLDPTSLQHCPSSPCPSTTARPLHTPLYNNMFTNMLFKLMTGSSPAAQAGSKKRGRPRGAGPGTGRGCGVPSNVPHGSDGQPGERIISLSQCLPTTSMNFSPHRFSAQAPKIIPPSPNCACMSLPSPLSLRFLFVPHSLSLTHSLTHSLSLSLLLFRKLNDDGDGCNPILFSISAFHTVLVSESPLFLPICLFLSRNLRSHDLLNEILSAKTFSRGCHDLNNKILEAKSFSRLLPSHYFVSLPSPLFFS